MVILGHFWPFLGTLEHPYGQYWGSTAFYLVFWCKAYMCASQIQRESSWIHSYCWTIWLICEKMVTLGHFGQFLGILEPPYGQYWGSTACFWLFYVRPICVQVRSTDNPVGSTHFVRAYGWYVKKCWFWAIFDHFWALWSPHMANIGVPLQIFGFFV